MFAAQRVENGPVRQRLAARRVLVEGARRVVAVTGHADRHPRGDDGGEGEQAPLVVDVGTRRFGGGGRRQKDVGLARRRRRQGVDDHQRLKPRQQSPGPMRVRGFAERVGFKADEGAYPVLLDSLQNVAEIRTGAGNQGEPQAVRSRQQGHGAHRSAAARKRPGSGQQPIGAEGPQQVAAADQYRPLRLPEALGDSFQALRLAPTEAAEIAGGDGIERRRQLPGRQRQV